MIELRKLIKSNLKAVHAKVYYQKAPDNAVCPYLVYELPTSYFNEYDGTLTLDVDGWDDEYDATALETLMAAVNAKFNRLQVVTDDFAVTFYLENKMSLREDDKRLNRRKYIYSGRIFERG